MMVIITNSLRAFLVLYYNILGDEICNELAEGWWMVLVYEEDCHGFTKHLERGLYEKDKA